MSRIQIITSAANPLLREVSKAVARGERTASGFCVAEGFHLLDEAFRSGREVPSILTSESARPAVERHTENLVAARIIVLPDALFQSISTTEATQGVIALVRPPEWAADQIYRGTPLVVVLDGIQDPGNAGAIVRAAEAFGASGLIFLKGTASPWNPKTMRASAGSLFRMPFVAGLNVERARAALLQHQITAYAAMPYTGTQKLASAADFSRPCAIIAGSEGRGVSQDLRAIAQEVAIPTTGVESLNTAVATAVLLYEARRQRQNA